MLAGIYYGAQYGGSTTAILVNMPGETSSVITTLDGHQMAKNGRAGPALAICAIGSFLAGTFATIVIVAAAPLLTHVALQFGAAEYFSLITLGLIFSVTLARGSIVNALGMLVCGLLFGLVGTDLYSGVARFTIDVPSLMDGLNIAAVAIGMFGIAELLRALENDRGETKRVQPIESIMPTTDDLRRSAYPIIRGSVLGSMLGVLPGGGAALASFASYALEKRVSKTPERFGRGAIEGVAGPESANNAAAQTSFIPMLTLGIPANSVMALMIGALVIQGIVPGPNIINNQPTLFWTLIASMWIGNFLLLILNLPLVGIWVRLISVPYEILFPAIVILSLFGVYATDNNTAQVYVLLFFGLFGYAMTKLDCEPAPLLLGLVLGPMMEEYFRRAMLLANGDPMTFILRPISGALLCAAVILLVIVARPFVWKRRDAIFVEEE